MRISHAGGVKAPGKYDSLKGKVSLLICTPTLDNKVNVNYTKSLLQTVSELSALEIPVVLGNNLQSCFIDLSRNLFVSQFMAGEFTHLLQIDSDMGWKAEDVLNLLLKDKEFIAGIGRKKLDNEEYAGVEYSTNGQPVGELGETEEDVLIKMKVIGGAFTLTKKSLFKKLQNRYTTLKTKLGDTDGYAFYKCEYHSYGLQTEDYYFCSLCEAIGIDIWCYPNIDMDHYEGRKNYKGNYFKYMKSLKLPEVRVQYA